MEIKIHNLTYSYKDSEKALDNIDLEISKGDFIGIIGNTGSGKSTLLKHFNAILKSSQGKVNILGRLIDDKSKQLKNIRKAVGVVFQFPEEQLFSETVREDILFGPKNFELEKNEVEKQLENLREIFDLGEEILSKNSAELSGGEQRRASIASVMISKPNILVLDEPTIGLDYKNRTKLLRLLREINKIGTSIILVSHDLHSVWPLLKRVVVLDKGKKIFDGDKISLLKDRKNFHRYFLPDYVEKLEELNLLEGNEEKALDEESCLNYIKEVFGGDNIA